MPLLKINADGDHPVLHGPGDLDARLARALNALPAAAPIVILIHGYKFSPAHPASDPHRHVLSLTPDPGCWKAISWPRHMGFGRDNPGEGLCIAFGWEARGSIWRAWAAAEQAGIALGDLVTRIAKLCARPVDILCHSLGARVALTGIADLPGGSVGRVILMAAAEYRDAARATLRLPAGRTAEFVNVTSRENDPFDALIEWLVPGHDKGDRALGAGLGDDAENWLDLQLDCPRSIEVLRDLGYRIPAPARRICHWSAYLRPGLLRFYRDMIRDRDLLPLDRLAGLLPVQAAPRWSGLWLGKVAAPRPLRDLLVLSSEKSRQTRRAPPWFSRFPVFRSRIS